MSTTLKALGVEVFSFTKSRQEEAFHQQQSLRISPFIQTEKESFDWSTIIAKPELVQLRQKRPQQFLSAETIEEDLLQGEAQWPYSENSLYFFTSTNPFRLSMLQTLRSKKFVFFMRLIAFINVAAICAYDYKSRISESEYERNRICITLEIFCNVLLGLECLAEIIVQGFAFGSNTYLKSWWNIMNFGTFFSTWAILGEINSENQLIHILRVLRIFKVLRLVQDSKTLKKQFDAFIGSFSRLGPILVPLLFVVLYYSIIGLHLFNGITEYRCRETPEPEEDGTWLANEEEKHLCGVWDCPEHTYCGSLADYGLPRNLTENSYEQFGFGFIRFDDFFYSLFVVFTFLTIIGWSGTTFMFWRAMTTYVTAFYFVSLIFILAYLLSNLLLASFYESFMVLSSIKQNKNSENEKEALELEIKKKKQQQMMFRLQQLNDQKNKKVKKKKYSISLFYEEEEDEQDSLAEKFSKFQHISHGIVKSNIFRYFSCVMIFISTIAIISDHHDIDQQTYERLLIVDFICIIYFIIELLMTIWGLGLEQFKEIIDIFDTIVIISQIILIIVLFFMDQPVIINYDKYVNFAKALKMLRLLKFLYVAQIFYSISVLARCLVQTLLKIKDMILLFIFLILLTSLFGQEFLAYKVRFEETPEGELELSHSNEGVSATINYEGFGNALMAATNVFYNEEWHITMFIHAQKIWVSILYHIFSILLGQVLLVRLFLAVFLNEFCQQLKKIEKEIKPINFLQHGKKVLTFINQLLKRRNRAKIHQNTMLSNQKVQRDSEKKITTQPPNRLSMFHELKEKQKKKESVSHNELLEKQVHTPSNIFSNKESMIDPLKNDKQQEKQTERIIQHEDELQDHNIQDEEQHDEENEQDSNSEENNIKSPEHPSSTQNLNKSIRKSMRKTNSEKTLFIFAPESDFRMLVTTLVTNIYFRIFNFTLILLTCIRIALLSPLEDPNSDLSYVLQIGYIFLTVFYVLVILLNCVAFGLYKTEQSFFRQSIYNIFSFAITIVDLITLIFEISHPLSKFITSLRILQFIQIGAVFSKNIEYAQASLLNAFTQMIQLALFCVVILAIYGVFALKILKGSQYYCAAYDIELKELIKTKTDCFDYGGSWINQILTFDTIFSSILTLFCVATSENWIPLQIQAWNSVGLDQQPIQSYNRSFALYFQVFFFFGFLCLLNMFIGLIVNAYQEAKMKAQNLHLLDETQREWFQIKMQIYTMMPLVKSKKPENAIRKMLFFMVKQKYFKIFWLVIIFSNTIILSIHFHRQDENYKYALDIINDIFVGIFAFEILCRFFAKEKHLYFKDISNIVDIIGIWWAIANLFIKNQEDQNFYFKRISNAISIAYQLQRNYRIIKRFNNLEKLFSSIFSVIPNALSMLFIMFIFLFIYTTLGIDMFAFIRTQTSLNGWDQHFRKFSTAMFSLIKVASSESWWTIMIDTLHDRSPNFACNYMSSYDDYQIYGFNGCGTQYAYLYFISFHIIFSLMILNLLIASVLVAYEEHVKSEESAVSKYQLNDVLSLWRNYDPEGKGFINYKDFWKLSSEIAIIFGVAQDDLLDVNNKKNFLKVLNIPIYESKESNMLCYKFYDVILSLTKISVTLKYGVTNLEPTDKVIQQKLLIQLGDLQHKELNNKFTPTSFNSGDMVAIIYIQKKFRLWKKRVQVLREGGDVKAIYNEMSDLKNMIKKQLELEEQEENKA